MISNTGISLVSMHQGEACERARAWMWQWQMCLKIGKVPMECVRKAADLLL